MNTLIAYLVEFIGTFIPLYVIISGGEPIAIAATFLGMFYFGGKLSGSSFNPAVSFLLFLNNKLSLSNLMGYVFMELLGGFAAVQLFNYYKL